MKKAAFFDRDGTINVNTGHLHEPDKLEFIEGTPELISKFNKADYLVIVITNQAGIAKGYYTKEQMHLLHKVMSSRLETEYSAHIDAYYFCPHHPDFTGVCSCRKPDTGMFKVAIADYDIDVSKSYMFGDMAHDLKAGEAMGIKSYNILEFLNSDYTID